MYRLRITVEEVRGFCDLPMRPGDYFELDGGRLTVPEGKHVCLWALQSLIPFLTVKQRRLAEENDWVPTTSRLSCPDPNGMVIYRVDILDPEGDPGHTRVQNAREAAGPMRDSPTEAAGIPSRMLVDKDACSGCRRCELACSFRHLGKYWPEMSRIRVDKDEGRGLDAPSVCRQCGAAKCVQACPEGALRRDPATKAVILDPSRCTKCLSCRAACPFDAIRIDSEGFPMICDLCGGDPACVEACPTRAVWFGRAGEARPAPKFAQPGKDRPKSSQRSERPRDPTRS